MKLLAIVFAGFLIMGCATEKKYNTNLVEQQAGKYRQCVLSTATELDEASDDVADIANEASGLCFAELEAINSLLREANKDHAYYGLYANNYTNGLRDQVTTEVATEIIKRRKN